MPAKSSTRSGGERGIATLLFLLRPYSTRLVEKRKMPEGALRRASLSLLMNVLPDIVEKRKIPEGALRRAEQDRCLPT